ncbi:hypothetical protein [Coleofasciculus sp. FACHB-SPT9]|uniref:hypothetical protein n=1 Tax=Cyanophyceae TaxID=3028117 RepID=UPI001F54DF38|nr:hypothetical protein [Coleofasciculus sp. FACHB-SPT9]
MSSFPNNLPAAQMKAIALVDAEDQLAATRCGIDAFSQADKSDVRGIEVFDQR